MIKTIFTVLCSFIFFPMNGLLTCSNISIYGNGNAVVANFNPVTSWATFDLKELLRKKESPKGFENALIQPISLDKIKNITILTDDYSKKINKSDKEYFGVT